MNARPVWTTACPDWTDRIVARRTLIPFAPLFPAEAAAALDVFRSLPLTDGPMVRDAATGALRLQTLGEACGDWVFDLVAAIFGAYDASTARRLIREFFLLISKKNGKSTIAAAIMLTALVRNWRHSAELLLLAPTLEVANNAYGPASDMAARHAVLADLLHRRDHKREIAHRGTNALLKVVAADSDTLGGSKAGFVFVDELWLFGKRPRAKAMLSEALGGMVARPEGFAIFATTHADEAAAGVMLEKLTYARQVRDGVISDPAFLPILYEWPPAMLEAEAYIDRRNFYVTNPNLGRSVSEDWLARELDKELSGDGSGKQIFLAKHLNVEIGVRLSSKRWRGTDYWAGGADGDLSSLEALLARSEAAVVGVDGGGLDDLFAVFVIGREKAPAGQTGRWLGWAHAWAHEDVLAIRKQIAPTLLDFEADGDLTICRDDPTADVRGAVAIIERVRDAGLLPEKQAVGVDPEGYGGLVDALAASRIVDPQLTGVKPQAFSLQSAVWTLERKLKDRTFVHGGQPLMNWAVGNAAVEMRGNSPFISKEVSGKAKIDPLIAALLAAKLMELNPRAASARQSIYDRLAAMTEEERRTYL